jgi:hypothetical protein
MINRQFSLRRGDTWPGFILTVTAADPVNDPIDFTGTTASSDIREVPDGPLLTTADVVITTTPEAAEITVSLPAAKSALLQGSVVSDVQIILSDGRVATPMAYQLNVSADVSRLGQGAIQSKTYSGTLSSCSTVCGPIAATVSMVPVIISTSSGGGVTDHGALTGLSDDDHTQYLTDARGDARYQVLIGNELKLRTIEGDVVTVTVVKIGGIYNLRIGQPT